MIVEQSEISIWRLGILSSIAAFWRGVIKLDDLGAGF
jgi:hypothetical protein